MKKNPLILFSFILIICLFLNLCFSAHSGKTDSSGGHINKSTGEYHYHHGYPAHKHTNGNCPYDFDDKTDHSTSTSIKKDSGNIPILGIVMLIIFISPICIFIFLHFIYYLKKNRH